MSFEETIDSQLQRLIDSYPRLFNSRPPRVLSHVEPGWYALVDELCTGIDHLLNEEQARKFKVDRIKEKFGTLRFYFSADRAQDTHLDILGPEGPVSFVKKTKTRMDFPMDQIRTLIENAYAKSATTCKSCGSFGLLRHDGWMRVLCNGCETNYQKALKVEQARNEP